MRQLSLEEHPQALTAEPFKILLASPMVLASVIALSLLPAGCVRAPSVHSENSSYIRTESSRWPNPRAIPVCIMNIHDIKPNLLNDLSTTVRTDYGTKAGVGYVGWEPCSDYYFKQSSVRVYFNPSQNWSDGNGSTGGNSLDGATGAGTNATMTINIDAKGEYPQNASEELKSRVRSTTLHEFGHVLGLMHEGDRHDSTCDRKTGAPGVNIGSYDPNSLMNYCRPAGQTLTQGDVAGIHTLYPELKGAGSQRKNSSNQKCWEIPEFSSDPGAPLQQRDCAPGVPNQLWRTQDLGNGEFEIRSSLTNTCLDVAGADLSSGAKVILWPCSGGDNQRVRLIDQTGGGKSVQFKHSGKCLDVPGSSTENGIQLQQWDCNGSSAQNFD